MAVSRFFQTPIQIIFSENGLVDPRQLSQVSDPMLGRVPLRGATGGPRVGQCAFPAGQGPARPSEAPPTLDEAQGRDQGRG